MTPTTLRRAALAGILAATVAAGCASPVDSAAPTTSTTEAPDDWEPAPRPPRPTTTTSTSTSTTTTVPPTTTTTVPTTTTTAAPAPTEIGPEMTRDLFLLVVHSETDSFDTAPDDLIVEAAQAACADLDAGASLLLVMADGATGFGATTEAEYGDVGFLVGAGIQAFCPQHQWQVDQLG